ncbi:hypothetical protein [Wenxinia marina]|uniref:Plant Basic Secretory Protein n=1 Tax=Wenxinia marina DSM 24838 TaxID=1123501 RepID=A0A0D0Q9E6_9RHOB|nr:hypothetical protein [Wenxinia marina]KIQ68992.1 hypothetical protein Wenmar_02725 [Wenxinia marina DSM 24838]
MRALPLLAALLLAACGRPLTPAETGFADAFLGPAIAPGAVRFHEGLAPEHPRTIPVRPRNTCQERLYPPPEVKTTEVTTAALTVFQNVHFRDSFWLEDYLDGLPEGRLNLAAAMIFAHEMVHVWQWQNRAETGYHPLKALFEHVGSPDPYLFDPDSTTGFLDYGWEQQGSIMEEYLCCRVLAPEAERTERLHAMLSEHFALPALDRPIASEVLLPWDGVRTEGICG